MFKFEHEINLSSKQLKNCSYEHPEILIIKLFLLKYLIKIAGALVMILYLAIRGIIYNLKCHFLL